MRGQPPLQQEATAYIQWQAALEQLERDLELAVQVSAERDGVDDEPAAVLSGAIPPVTHKIPAQLAPRARALADRQRELSELLSARLAQTGQQQRATAQFSDPHRSAVYVDVTA